MPIEPNALCHADSLVLLERLDERKARLIYLDPPWFSQPVRGHGGSRAPELLGLRDYLGYLSRVLQQCHRVLAEDGNIFVHAEPTLSRKFGLLLDQIFRDGYRAEYFLHHRRSDQFARHETILHYAKGRDSVYNRVTRPLGPNEAGAYGGTDQNGAFKLTELTAPHHRAIQQYEWRGHRPSPSRNWRFAPEDLDRLDREGRIFFPKGGGMPKLKVYVSESAGVDVGTLWNDLSPREHQNSRAPQFVTQQPVDLLDRIIKIGSNEGDVIVDPFCGSGTAMVAAGNAGRKWIGGDTSPEAIAFARSRLMPDDEQPKAGGRIASYSSADVSRIEVRPCFYRRVVTLAEDLNEAEVLITEGESEWVEFKVAAMFNPFTRKADEQIKEKIIRTVSAFLNSRDGGTLVVGVDDAGNVHGLEDDYKLADPRVPGRDKYELWLRNVLASRLGGLFAGFYRITFADVGGKDVCLIRVAPGYRPSFIADSFCVRAGNQTVELKARGAIEYARERWS